MKRFFRILLTLSCLIFCVTAWAARSISIQVNGIDGAPQKNVTNALENLLKSYEPNVTATQLVEFRSKAPKAATEALKAFGYFRASIQSQRRGNTFLFTVRPGPRMRVTDVKLQIRGSGLHDKKFIRLVKRFPVKTGDYFDVTQYDKAKQQLFDIASSRGYFSARMNRSRIIINLIQYKAKVVIIFDTGERYRIGTIHVSKTPLNPKFVRRYLRFKEGQYYNYTRLQRTQLDLMQSNYFSQVIVSPMIKEARHHRMPIRVQLSTQKRFLYSMGVGYGTDTGARGTLEIHNRRVNSWGHQANFVIRGAQKDSTMYANYLIPGRHPARDQFGFHGGYTYIDDSSGKSRSILVGASYASKFNDWSLTNSLNFLNEQSSLKGSPYVNTVMLYPNFHLQYLKPKRNLNPSQGINFIANLAGTPSFLTKRQGAFVQLKLSVSLLYTILHNTRLLMRSQIGRTEIDDLSHLPLTLQLFAGGSRSIRGYAYNSIGPGRNLFTGTFEVQQRIYKNLYIAGFIDAGNVTSKSPFENLNRSVGPALVWLSPVGMVELSVAKALDKSSKPWGINFSIGPSL